MDKANNYLLIQEGKVGKLTRSMKIILPNIKSALIKGNKNSMKVIAKRLPQKNIKAVERDAIRRIPNFKNNYKKAQRKISMTKKFDSYTAKPAAIATALVASSTKHSIDDIIKKGQMGVRNAKILPMPGYFFLVKLAFFTTAITSIYLTDGAVILPTIQLAFHAVGLIASILGVILSGIGDANWDSTPKVTDVVSSVVKKSFERPTSDPNDIVGNIKNMMPAGDDENALQHLIYMDPLGLS